MFNKVQSGGYATDGPWEDALCQLFGPFMMTGSAAKEPEL
jgi:hypothetical protein